MMHIGDPYEDLPRTPKLPTVGFRWSSWEFLSVFQVLTSLVVATLYAVQGKWGLFAVWLVTTAVWGATFWKTHRVRLEEAKSRAVLEELSTAPLGKSSSE